MEDDILIKLYKTLERMEKEGRINTEGYKNLKMKYEAIKQGCPYKITNITEKMIMSYGAIIPCCNVLTKYNPGYMMKKINEATNFIRSLWEDENYEKNKHF